MNLALSYVSEAIENCFQGKLVDRLSPKAPVPILRRSGASDIYHLLMHRAHLSPDAPGFRFFDNSGEIKKLSWSEIKEICSFYAAGLSGLGVTEYSRVAIALPQGHRWELIHLALMACGATVIGVVPEELDSFQPSEFDLDAVIVEKPEFFGSTEIFRGVRVIKLHEILGECANSSRKLPAKLPFLYNEGAALQRLSNSDNDRKTEVLTHAQMLEASMLIGEQFLTKSGDALVLSWLSNDRVFQRIMHLIAIDRNLTIFFLDKPENLSLILAQFKIDILPCDSESLVQLFAKFKALNRSLARAFLFKSLMIAIRKSERLTLFCEIFVPLNKVLKKLFRRLCTRADSPLPFWKLRTLISSSEVPTEVREFLSALGLSLIEFGKQGGAAVTRVAKRRV